MSNLHREHYEQVAYTGSTLLCNQDEYDRLTTIKSLIPLDVHRILDCGCGDGRLGNLLKDDYIVEGCDIASAPLKYCKFPTVQSSLTKLPFDDHSFDLVVCSEVLEHILPGEYHQVCREIERVARRWIIITVPNREDLDAARQRCPHCGTIFHDAWHIRRMDEETLISSFPNFSKKQLFYVGHKQRLDYILRRKLKNKLFGFPALKPNRQCPLCQCFGTTSGKPNPPAASENSVIPVDKRPDWYKKLRRWALTIVPGRSRWLGVLMERQTNS